MSFNNGPTVITNGLVLALDAGDRNSYNSGSTTWFDLTGVNNGTLTNGPTFNTGSGGSIVFDGVDDYVNMGNVLPLGTSNFTCNFWFRTPTGIDGYLISKKNAGYTTNTAGFGIFKDTSGGRLRITLSDGASVATPFLGTTDVGTNTWLNCCVVINRTSGLCTNYLNSVADTPQNIAGVTGNINNSANLIIASGFDSWAQFDGQIATTQIYNRALSADEVLQNYNATKGRFGL